MSETCDMAKRTTFVTSFKCQFNPTQVSAIVFAAIVVDFIWSFRSECAEEPKEIALQWPTQSNECVCVLQVEQQTIPYHLLYLSSVERRGHFFFYFHI